MILLAAENLAAGYDGKRIVSGVSFTLAAGELCALLGLNGSGKTTLLRALSGLLPPLSGRCLLGGEDASGLTEHRRARHLSYLPQRSSEMNGVSVLDAVMMGFHARLHPLSFPSPADRALALRTLDEIGLSGLADKDYSQLSEGQKQKAILARTLLQNAPVMLMDEPDSALDFTGRNRAMADLRRLIREKGKAGLCSLHDPGLALAYCDRLLLIRDGGIRADIPVAKTNLQLLQAHLSEVYENIRLLTHDGKLLAVYEEYKVETN